MVASCLDSLEPILLEGFESKEDLVACLKASANVPRIAGDPVEHRSAPRASLNLHTLRAISSFRLYFAAAVIDSNTSHTSIGAIANRQSCHLGVICCSSGIGACPELVQEKQRLSAYIVCLQKPITAFSGLSLGQHICGRPPESQRHLPLC